MESTRHVCRTGKDSIATSPNRVLAHISRCVQITVSSLLIAVFLPCAEPSFAADGLGTVALSITCDPSPLPGGIPNGWWWEIWYNEPGVGWTKDTYGNYSFSKGYQKASWANKAIEFKLRLVFGNYWQTYDYFASSPAGLTDVSFTAKPHATFTGYISPQAPIDAGAKWRFTTGSDTGWKNNGQTVEIALTTCPEERIIEFSSVPGWITPLSAIVSFLQEDDKWVTGAYTIRVPSAPTGLSASDGVYSNKVLVSWNSSAWASGYSVWRNTSNSSTNATLIADNVAGTTYDDSSAPVGILFYYWVKAKNSGGASAFSASDAGYKLVAIPAPPANVAASDAMYTARVSVVWSSSPGAIEYELWRNSTNDSTSATQIADHLATTAYDDTTAGLGLSYFYWIKAKNVAGVSAVSLSDSGCRQLMPPTGVAASHGQYTDKVLIAWASPNSNVCYEVWRNSTNAVNTAVLQTVVISNIYEDTNTVAGQCYYYWIRATNAVSGESSFSAPDGGFRNISAPSNVTATLAAFTDRVDIAWFGNPDASSYSILRGVSTNATLANPIGSSPSQTFSDTTLTPGVTYFYWVTAQNAFITSSVSSFSVGRAVARPPQPSGVIATDGIYADHVQVSWSAALDAAKYHIYRSTNEVAGTAVKQAETTLLAYSDTTAVRDQIYYYWVQAANMAGVSDISISDAGRLMNLPVPPIGLSASDGTFGDRIVIHWSACADAAAYEVWRNTENNPAGAVMLSTLTGTNYDDSNVTSSVVYHYWIKSTNSLGVSSFGASDTGYVPGVPSAPTFVSASAGTEEDAVRVLWTAVSGASRYEIWRNAVNNTNSASLLGLAMTNGYSDTTLVPGSVAYYWVKAANLAGKSSFSPSAFGFAGVSRPTDLQASDAMSTDRVSVAWNATRGATSYDVFRHTTNDAATAAFLSEVFSTNYVDVSCDPAALYYYWVRAKNALSVGELCPPDTGHLALAPPVFRSVGPDVTATKVELNWLPVTGAVAYAVWRAESNALQLATQLAVQPGTNAIDENVNAYTRYFYWVRGENAHTTSTWSSVATAFLLNAPTDVSASDGTRGDSIEIQWAPATNAATYEVWRNGSDDPAGSVLVAEVASPPFVDTNVAASVAYCYWIRSKNSIGVSVLSTPDQGFVAAIPIAPSGVSATKGLIEEAVVVGWSQSAVATRYEIWRCSSNNAGCATMVGQATTNAYTDITLIPGSIAYYWVKAANLSGASTFSTSDFGFSGLARPQCVLASDGASTNGITITWCAASGATSYDILRHTANDVGWAQVLGETTATNYVDTTCGPADLCYYWVRAKNELSIGTPSSSDTGYFALQPPIMESVSAGSYTGQIVLSWSPVAGAFSYGIWRAESNDVTLATQIAVTNINCITDSGVTPHIRYHYWVRAQNGHTTSPWSKSAMGFLLTAPDGITATKGSATGGVVVVWKPTEGAIMYEVWRATNAAPATACKTGETLTTNFTDSAAVPGSLYYYWVRSISLCDTSQFSSVDSGFVRLARPTSVSATTGSYTDRVVVAWAPCLGAEYYEVWRHTEDNSGFSLLVGQSASNTFADSTAVPGVQYFYWVRAYNSLSVGELSQSVQGFALAPPSPPYIVSASAGTMLNKINVDWTPVVGASGYELWRNTSPSTVGATKHAEVLTPSFADTNAVVGPLYYYWVKTKNLLGTSSFSSPAVGFVAVPPPAWLTASDGTFVSHVQVDWAPVSGASSYELWRSTNNSVGEAVRLVQTTTNAFQDSSATPDVVYYYWAKAKTSFADSDASMSDTGHVASVFAVRSIDGTNVTVSVTVNPLIQCFALEELLPTNITPGVITSNGTWDARNHKVKWGPFTAQTSAELHYSVAGNPGEFTIEGTISCDGALAAISGNQLLRVPYSYTQWKDLAFGATATNDSISGRMSDPDGDTVPNLLEYAFHMDPNVNSRVGLPVFSLWRDSTNCFLIVEFTRFRLATDIWYNVEVTDNLMTTWLTGSPYTEVLSVIDRGDGTETVRVKDAGSPTNTGCRFLRLTLEEK